MWSLLGRYFSGGFEDDPTQVVMAGDKDKGAVGDISFGDIGIILKFNVKRNAVESTLG